MGSLWSFQFKSLFGFESYHFSLRFFGFAIVIYLDARTVPLLQVVKGILSWAGGQAANCDTYFHLEVEDDAPRNDEGTAIVGRNILDEKFDKLIRIVWLLVVMIVAMFGVGVMYVLK